MQATVANSGNTQTIYEKSFITQWSPCKTNLRIRDTKYTRISNVK